MKTLLMAFLLSSTLAYASAPEVIYQNKNWETLRIPRPDLPDQCVVISNPSKIKNGHVYLVFFTNKTIIFTGYNVDSYLADANEVELRVGDTPMLRIPISSVFSGILVIHDLLSGGHENIQVGVAFDLGEKDIHTFPIHGFSGAYHALNKCAAWN